MKAYEEDSQTKKEHKAARKLTSRRDRSKFKKTDLEKRTKRLLQQTQERLAKKNLIQGRVLAILPEEIRVDSKEGIFQCIIRGALKKEITQAKNLIAVGDLVLFEKENNQSGSIVHVEERYSLLSRQEHLRRRQKQLIAANIDQVLITVSVMTPPLKPALIDRYIIATFKGGMEPIILVNKVDLLEDGEEKERLDLLKCTYQALNIPIIAVSAVTGEGIDQLKEQMKNRASVFSGQSGVGKSSLINLMTGLNLSIGEVVRKTQKGSHTTTHAQLIPLEQGGWCIDTPGIRSFGIWDLKIEDLNIYFPEIFELSHHCRYQNCTHSHEPGCALEEALAKKQLSPLRLDSYLKLLQELKPLRR